MVAATAEAVSTAANAADDAAAKIRSQINSTVSSMHAQAASFTGSAGSAFRSVLNQFAEEMDKNILQRLETLAANTRTAANQLFAQDDDSAAALTKAGTTHTGVTGGLT